MANKIKFNYSVRERETGRTLGRFETISQCKNAIAIFEDIDKENGTYKKGKYMMWVEE